jgi:hypothetical protein
MNPKGRLGKRKVEGEGEGEGEGERETRKGRKKGEITLIKKIKKAFLEYNLQDSSRHINTLLMKN